jgi:uncharacterized protein (DUF433 family)
MKDYVEERGGGLYLVGSRVSLDSIVWGWREGQSPETIQQNFPSLKLEQIYGAITFLLAERERVEAYMAEQERRWEEGAKAHPMPTELEERLAAFRAVAGRRV